MKISDANIYVVRHEYTEKYMLKMISEKYFNKEVSHLGLVYNDYHIKQGYGYGYGYMVTVMATVMVILMKTKIIKNQPL
jgi:hypothetical protein